MVNYKKICDGLLSDLRSRTKKVISRRFGLTSTRKKLSSGVCHRETLESIGMDYGITRERVRQIEEYGFSEIKKKTNQCQAAFKYFTDELKKTGNFRKEESLLYSLGGLEFQNYVFFLLTLGESFQRFGETKEFYASWATDTGSFASARKTINFFCEWLKEKKQPLLLDNFSSLAVSVSPAELNENIPSCLEISKTIQRGPEGLFGLRDWPEINPRGVKDWLYLTFKKVGKPLHFTKAAELINSLYPVQHRILPQTVHNELIKDQRFVLVGRGLYALKEWGYEDGVVKDVIFKVLERAKSPLAREEIIQEVLKQRFVRENTILLNLNDKQYFLKNNEGKYTIRSS